MRAFRFAALLVLSTLACENAAGAERLVIGTEGAYPPFNSLTASGELIGFDVDIAKALCERMAVECSFVAVDWDGLVPALQAGRIDVIMASLTINEERRKHVLFTRKYYATPLSIVARKEVAPATTDPSGFDGMALGIQAGTWQADYASSTYAAEGADLKLYPSQTEVMLDLSNGRLEAVLSDRIQLVDWMKADGSQCCTMVGDVPGTAAEAGIAVRIGENDLRDRLQHALDAIRKNGEYDAIRKGYFDFDIFGE